MSSTTATGSTLGVLARQEIRNYLKSKLFWFGAALTLVVDGLLLAGSEPGSSADYMIAPAAMLGVLGVSVMFGLTRRSDAAAEAAGTVAVPERTRTLALAAATIVPFSVALGSLVVAVVTWYLHPPAGWAVPPGIPDAFIFIEMFGDGVMCAVGGPILGLLLARYLPKRGVSAVASVLLVIVTILLQGNGLVGDEQRYRVFWFWTYFMSQQAEGGPGNHHIATNPGNPFFWVVYLMAVCTLGIVVAIRHDPDSDRATLTKLAFGLAVGAVALGVLTMTVGFTERVVSPVVCSVC